MIIFRNIESKRSQSNHKAANIRWAQWREKRKAQEQQLEEQEYADQDNLTRLQQIEQRLRRIENEPALT